MESGVSIDPVTGRPREEAEKKRKEAITDKEKATLQAQAKLEQVTSSEAADVLREMIRDMLMSRVGDVLKDDPQAAAYVEILKKLKEKENLARLAVSRLVEKGHL